jgi:hypothetical protein
MSKWFQMPWLASSTEAGPWGRLAQIISDLTNPLYLAVPTFLIMALSTAPDMVHALLWWAVATVGISIAPLLFIWRGIRRGVYSDYHVSIREQRLITLVFGLSSITITFAVLLLLEASLVLIAAMTAVLVVCGLSLLITSYWKISLHLVGVAGAVTAFVLLFGPRLLKLEKN